MRERPILFSGPMIRAILAGQKTVTRRPVKPQPRGIVYADRSPPRIELVSGGCGAGWADLRCPYGSPGDRLWVRETFSVERRHIYPCPLAWYRADFEPADYAAHTAERYCQDESDCLHGIHWKPGTHLPRRLSRLLLEVTEVRVERLQTITEEDARAEGFADRAAFRDAWGAMYGGTQFYTDFNPWVWVVSFRRVEGGRDA